MALSREQFTRASQRRYDTINMPGLGEIRLQSLTAGEMRAIRKSLYGSDGKPDMERLTRIDALVVAASVVDDDGTPLFTDDDAMGSTFERLDGGAWNAIVAAVKRHTGWDCGEDWQPIKAAAKN